MRLLWRVLLSALLKDYAKRSGIRPLAHWATVAAIGSFGIPIVLVIGAVNLSWDVTIAALAVWQLWPLILFAVDIYAVAFCYRFGKRLKPWVPHW